MVSLLFVAILLLHFVVFDYGTTAMAFVARAGSARPLTRGKTPPTSSLTVSFRAHDGGEEGMHGGRTELPSRRELLRGLARSAVAAAVTIPAQVRAASGDATSMAVPAVVPSPIKPTGEMGKVCNVVALGREDVCLEPKKPPSAYDKVLLGRELDAIDSESSSPTDALRRKLLTSVLESEWETCEQAVGELPKKSGVPGSTLKSLRKGLKDGDGPTVVKAVLEVSKKL
mmetsp:Transcript_24001/g.56643  ORF Transcript_24001/g.56643 Transcript_24001/m.56643 type:complete len:228 (+) Transcript_24001:68-751(+)